jgi:hypothetical protein
MQNKGSKIENLDGKGIRAGKEDEFNMKKYLFTKDYRYYFTMYVKNI